MPCPARSGTAPTTYPGAQARVELGLRLDRASEALRRRSAAGGEWSTDQASRKSERCDRAGSPLTADIAIGRLVVHGLVHARSTFGPRAGPRSHGTVLAMHTAQGSLAWRIQGRRRGPFRRRLSGPEPSGTSVLPDWPSSSAVGAPDRASLRLVTLLALAALARVWTLR
jgi:hypothetical protein